MNEKGGNAALNGYLLGLAGVIAFGGTLPATRILVMNVDPVLITLARASIAGLAAMALLAAGRIPMLPPRAEWPGLAIVIAALVLGFPLLMALAMAHVPASHGVAMLGILPLATAAAGCLFSPERPSLAFWLVGALGSATVIGFALRQGGGAISFADLALLAAVVSAGIGYAKGAALTARLGGWRVTCWVVVICLPVTVPATLWMAWLDPPDLSARDGAALAYIALISQLLAFLPWYIGLAMGGIAPVSQLMLLLPFVTIAFGHFLIGEALDDATIAFCLAVAVIVLIGKRMPIRA
jgi:drug/metabolite transporter (DMT)-like permease